MGTLHNGATVNTTSTAFTTSGNHDTTTDVTVAAGSGTINGITISGGPTSFNGTTSSDTRNLAGTIANASGGTTAGTFNLGVTGEGLTGEGAYSNVGVAYTSFVYTGQGIWNTNGGGIWGAVSATPVNWTANGGTPGLDGNFTSTDSATFGGILTGGTANVRLDGDNPSLNAITFNDSAASYNLTQGTGGSISLNGGAGSATVTDLAGTHTISAPVSLTTSTNVNVASGQQLTFSGNISGSGGLTTTGTGITALSGANTYGGITSVNAGTLVAANASALSTGAVNQSGGTLETDNINHVIVMSNGFNQTGGLLVLNLNSVPGAASNDQVNVSGAATLNGNLKINYAAGALAPSQSETYTVITTTGGINNVNVAGYQPPALQAGALRISITGAVNGDDFDVTLTGIQTAFTALAGTNLTPNQQSVASYLDRFDGTRFLRPGSPAVASP